jgi:hypothetical protein
MRASSYSALGTRYSVLSALLAALAVLLVAWFVDLPRIIAGEEELASVRLPQTRAAVMSSKQGFERARDEYRMYVSSHDLAALRAGALETIERARDDSGALPDLNERLSQIAGYAQVLHRYAEAGDRYFLDLRRYDDNLMAWTRSLGAGSESLRDETWPIVEHLKLYPKPVGLVADPPEVKASKVLTQINYLERDADALNAAPSHDEPSPLLYDLAWDIAGLWDSGRAVEYVAGLDDHSGLHSEYYRTLETYDRKVQAQAGGVNEGPQSAGRRALATGLNLLLGLVTLGGLAALFAPRRAEDQLKVQD